MFLIIPIISWGGRKLNKTRQELRKGLILTPEKFKCSDICWHGGVKFYQIDKMPDSVKWWFSCLGFLRLLILNNKLTCSDERICRLIVKDFFSNNGSITNNSFSRAWDGHAVALRAGVLLDIYNGSLDKKYLEPIIFDHMLFLEDQKNFQGHWNHGVDQSISLIQLADFLNNKRALKTGVNRLFDSLSVLVDDEGATIEQSIHYQLYNYKQLGRAIGLLEKLNESSFNEFLAELKRRRLLMGEFLAHATKPDGHYFEIGDTPAQRAEVIDDDSALYAATQGQGGEAPKDNIKIFKSGYIFGRSGWGKGVQLKDESAYAIRFGAPRKIHGHFDHLSLLYHSKGIDILRDGGFHGYTDDSTRHYLRSASAHNSITASHPLIKANPSYSKLLDHTINKDFSKFSLASSPYNGVDFKRTLIFISNPEVIVVLDSILCDRNISVNQRWHFGDNILLERTVSNSVVSKDKLLEVTQHYPIDRLSVYNSMDSDNPSCVAGENMYETSRSPLIISERSGKNVTFLTTFSIANDGKHPEIVDKRLGNNGIRRSLVIKGKFKKTRINFFENGTLSVI